MKAEESKEAPDRAMIEELGVALQYLAQDHGSTRATLESLADHDEVTFELLWAIFPPGLTVYTKDNLLREQQVLKLQSGDYRELQNHTKVYVLDLLFILHDEEKLGWTRTKY